jgi:hypothetical protein
MPLEREQFEEGGCQIESKNQYQSMPALSTCDSRVVARMVHTRARGQSALAIVTARRVESN